MRWKDRTEEANSFFYRKDNEKVFHGSSGLNADNDNDGIDVVYK